MIANVIRQWVRHSPNGHDVLISIFGAGVTFMVIALVIVFSLTGLTAAVRAVKQAWRRA